ncbi:MAG: response regulator transcription factor [Rhodoferax sp.]|nr:response regulator transcription factor [Rhodoferax sp.]
MIKVILCDDHAMVRRGIRDTLAEAVDIQVVGESGSYSEVRELIRTTPCDVLILDLNLPGRGGLEVLASLREDQSAIRVLIVSMFAEDQYAIRCLRAGADGYLNKAGDPSELIPAVRSLAKGRKYVTPEISEMLVSNLASPSTQSLHATLSERELQTLLKIASGKRLSDIAEELMLSPKTVSVYRARLLEKLKLSNNAELAVYAIRNELV